MPHAAAPSHPGRVPLLLFALAFATGLALVYVQHVTHEHARPAPQPPAVTAGRAETAADRPAP